MEGEVLALVMFAATCGILLLGFPVAFSLAGSALIFAFIGVLTGTFDFRLMGVLGSRYFGVMVNEVLVAVPLFIFMGVMLERSKLAEELLATMAMLFGRRRGGLGISVILVGALLAASTGIVGATVVTMGLLSLPTMLRSGYDPRLASGLVCSSGTLGQIIPPSIVLVLLGDILQGANTQAQLALGNFAPEPVAVVDLFAGAFIPGIVLVLLYIGWQIVVAIVRPQWCPPIEQEGDGASVVQIATVLAPPALLMVAVLGSILAGIATPTESAAVGAVGAMLLAASRGQLGVAVLKDVMRTTTRITSMVFVILLGASLFSLTFRGFGWGFHRDAYRHGGDVRPRLLPRLHRNRFRRGAHRRSDSASDGTQSDLAWRHDRRQPSNVVPDAALRVRAVLSSQRGAAQHHDNGHLSRRRPLRGHSDRRARRDRGVPRSGHMVAQGHVRLTCPKENGGPCPPFAVVACLSPG